MYGGDENLYLAFVKEELTEEQRADLITANQCLHAGYVSVELLGVRRSYYAKPEEWFVSFVQGKGPLSGPC
jgi:hypothetical protein